MASHEPARRDRERRQQQAGVAAKVVDRLQHPLCSSGLYVALGWLALVTIGPMVEPIATGGLALIVGGGVADTLGALCFLIEARMRYAHSVWHLAPERKQHDDGNRGREVVQRTTAARVHDARMRR
jgi:hypothetical protein